MPYLFLKECIMKNLLLIVAFLGFMISPSFAATTVTSSNIEFCEDDKKCDKKNCKKGDKKECKKGDKKACCSKDAKKATASANAKKSCCASKTSGKTCSKSKAASTTKTTEKQ